MARAKERCWSSSINRWAVKRATLGTLRSKSPLLRSWRAERPLPPFRGKLNTLRVLDRQEDEERDGFLFVSEEDESETPNLAAHCSNSFSTDDSSFSIEVETGDMTCVFVC